MGYKGADNYDLHCMCEICGDHVSSSVDHTECSKLKKEIYGDSKENKRPRKKLSKRDADKLSAYINSKCD